MIVWVPGATGMLGQEVVKALASVDAQVLSTGKELDIRDAGEVGRFTRAHDVTHIVNCAAFTDVEGAEDQSAEAFALNADGPENLARSAIETSATLLHVSTDYVFDGEANEPYPETAATGPLNVYGASKLEGEQRIKKIFEAAGEPSSYAIVRTSWLFGTQGRCFPSVMLRLFGEREQLEIVDDQTGAPTYAVDLAQALVAICLDPEITKQSKIVHFTNSGSTTWYGLAVYLMQMSRAADVVVKTKRLIPVPSASYPQKATRPRVSVLCTDRWASFFSPPRKWTDAVGDYLQARRQLQRGDGDAQS